MRLPAEIPDLLQERTIAVGSGERVFRAEDALEAIRALTATRVAIVGGRVYRSAPWGVAPLEEGWTCEPAPGEPLPDFAERSRQAASGYIETYTEDHAGQALFLLLFDRGDEPA